MTDIKPKPENLKDPYVIQLIGTIALLESKIEDLEEGACRFNCRKQKDAFMAGWLACDKLLEYEFCIINEEPISNPNKAYKEWKRERS